MNTVKITLKIITLVFLLFTTIFTLNKITESNKIKKDRSKVNNLIYVGQNFIEAQDILKKEGFKLVDEYPIDSTGLNQHVNQLVIIGDRVPDIDETFFYVYGCGRSPFALNPYVGIEASIEGKITSIE